MVHNAEPTPSYEMDPVPGTYNLSTVDTINVKVTDRPASCVKMWIRPVDPEDGSWSQYDEDPFYSGYTTDCNSEMQIKILQPIHFNLLRASYEDANGKIWNDNFQASYNFIP
jgi:hypothetical protein